MKKRKIFGYNLRKIIEEKKLDYKEVAESLEYEIIDFCRVLDGRCVLSYDEQQDIADYLHVSVEELLEQQSIENYAAAGCFEFRGQFEYPENFDKIMELFDDYCDVQELLV